MPLLCLWQQNVSNRTLQHFTTLTHSPRQDYMHTFHQCDYMYTGDDDGRMVGSFFCNRTLSKTNMEHSPICSLAGDELTRATYAAANAKQGVVSPPVESFNMVYTKMQVERGAVWRSSTTFNAYVLLIPLVVQIPL